MGLAFTLDNGTLSCAKDGVGRHHPWLVRLLPWLFVGGGRGLLRRSWFSVLLPWAALCSLASCCLAACLIVVALGGLGAVIALNVVHCCHNGLVMTETVSVHI